ncbi:hypothetical protein AAFX24_27820 [Vibrio mediterranei]|uniref:Eco57I restriction-modification methylase domain-containing protein n=1 Tax=Vibrio mediterranei TaxID=689 RepID=UPI0038CEE1E5
MLQYDLDAPTAPATNFADVLHLVDANSDKWTSATTKALSRKMGQVFSPLAMASQLSSLIPQGSFQNHQQLIADPGAGTGILSTSLAARAYLERATPMSIFGFETDKRLVEDWDLAWELFQKQADTQIDQYLLEDFALHAKSLLADGHLPGLPRPEFVTTNPPYCRLGKETALSHVMTEHGIPVSNLYACFIALGASWLQDNGHLLAIIPRSFASGDYFKVFRRWLGTRMSVEHIVLYKSRSCFKNVLQENICLYMRKRAQSPRVRITVSENPTSLPDYDLILPAKDTITDEGWWLPRTVEDIELINKNRLRPNTLESLGLNMSTGKMELHRLSESSEAVSTPVIYAKDFDKAGKWVWGEVKKPRQVNVLSKQVLELPAEGGYVVLKRISSNDGTLPKRLFPAWLSRESIGYDRVTLDNHVQYFHEQGAPIDTEKGKALVRFLQSEEAQSVIRAIAGTTQVNKADISKLKFPELSQ